MAVAKKTSLTYGEFEKLFLSKGYQSLAKETRFDLDTVIAISHFVESVEDISRHFGDIQKKLLADHAVRDDKDQMIPAPGGFKVSAEYHTKYTELKEKTIEDKTIPIVTIQKKQLEDIFKKDKEQVLSGSDMIALKKFINLKGLKKV